LLVISIDSYYDSRIHEYYIFIYSKQNINARPQQLFYNQYEMIYLTAIG